MRRSTRTRTTGCAIGAMSAVCPDDAGGTHPIVAPTFKETQ